MKRISSKGKCKCQKCNSVEEIYPETKQKMIRPELHIKKAVAVSILLFLMDNALAYVTVKAIRILNILNFASWESLYAILVAFFLIGTLILFAKRIVIFTIRIYQKFAPFDIRSSCLFVPNCSEYMILAIQKYGLIKGIKKGVNRYKRCRVPNGGIDYP